MTIVEPGKEHEFLDPLPVQRIWGVGKKSLISLEKIGIHTIGHLRQYPADALTKKFGKMGDHLHRMANGIDEREVHDRDPVKSVSHETTFFEDQTDREFLISTLLKLSEKSAHDCGNSSCAAKRFSSNCGFPIFQPLRVPKPCSNPLI
ncbi:MAG: hypothetical protein R3C26_06570 [Calditrichia bacterium]